MVRFSRFNFTCSKFVFETVSLVEWNFAWLHKHFWNVCHRIKLSWCSCLLLANQLFFPAILFLYCIWYILLLCLMPTRSWALKMGLHQCHIMTCLSNISEMPAIINKRNTELYCVLRVLLNVIVIHFNFVEYFDEWTNAPWTLLF